MTPWDGHLLLLHLLIDAVIVDGDALDEAESALASHVEEGGTLVLLGRVFTEQLLFAELPRRAGQRPSPVSSELAMSEEQRWPRVSPSLGKTNKCVQLAIKVRAAIER